MAVIRSFRFRLSRPGMAWRRETRVPSAMLAASWRMRCSPLQTGICPSWRAVSAASQSIQAIRVVPSLMLVPVHEAGEVVAGQDAAVADEQLGAGFLGV